MVNNLENYYCNLKHALDLVACADSPDLSYVTFMQYVDSS